MPEVTLQIKKKARVIGGLCAPNCPGLSSDSEKCLEFDQRLDETDDGMFIRCMECSIAEIKPMNIPAKRG
jgi:hypothetical protein